MMIDPQMIQRLMEFMKSYKGNAQAEVMNLLNSGRVSQQQLDQAQNMARMIQQAMKGK